MIVKGEHFGIAFEISTVQMMAFWVAEVRIGDVLYEGPPVRSDRKAVGWGVIEVATRIDELRGVPRLRRASDR